MHVQLIKDFVSFDLKSLICTFTSPWPDLHMLVLASLFFLYFFKEEGKGKRLCFEVITVSLCTAQLESS